VAEHRQALTDLDDKDKIIDDLLRTADDLVSELRMSLGRASASLRDSAEGADDDSG
jgi:ABC-type transporter Mla subunit MlaD